MPLSSPIRWVYNGGIDPAGGRPMTGYRLYFLNGKGRVDHAFPFESETDLQAIEAVRACPNRHGAELWRLGRRLRTFEPWPSPDAEIRPNLAGQSSPTRP